MEENNLYKALIAAQAEFVPALKDTKNPFFKSSYAPLDSIWNACKGPLAKNKLFVSQITDYKDNIGWVVITKVYDAVGDSIQSVTPIIVTKTNDPQAFGSAMTYTRRYSLAAILGIVTDDDDGEGAMDRNNENKNKASNNTINSALPPQAVKIKDSEKQEILRLIESPLVSPIFRESTLKNIDNWSSEEATSAIQTIKNGIAEREKLPATEAQKEKLLVLLKELHHQASIHKTQETRINNLKNQKEAYALLAEYTALVKNLPVKA